MTDPANSLSLEQIRFIFERRNRDLSAILEIQNQIKAGLEDGASNLEDLRALLNVQSEFIDDVCHQQLIEHWKRTDDFQKTEE